MPSTGYSNNPKPGKRYTQVFSYPSLLVLGLLILAFILGTFVFSLNTPYIGARLSRADGRWSVTQVDPGGIAHKSGIKAGDSVISINGRPAREIDKLVSPVAVRDLTVADVLGVARSVSVEDAVVSADTILESVIFLIIALAFWLTGFVIYWLRPTTRHVRLLYLLYVLIATLYMAQLGSTRNVTWIQHVERISWFLAPSVFLHFCLVFPVKKQPARLGRWLLPAVYLPAAVLITSYIAWGRYEAVYYPTFRPLMVFNMMVGLLLGACALVHTFVTNKYVRFRQQIKIIMFGVMAAISPIIVLVILPDVLFQKTLVQPSLSSLTMPLMPIALGYAVVRHKLFDVDLMIRRAAFYAVLVLPLLLVYAGMLLTLNYFLKTSGMIERNFALLLFTGTAFFLLLRAGSLVTRIINRMLYTSGYDYKRSVKGVTTALASISDYDLLARFAVTSISNTLGLSGTALLLRDNNGQLLLKESTGVYADEADLRDQVVRLSREAGEEALFPNLPPPGSPVAFLVPLKAGDRQAGILCLGRKRSTADFSTDDISFILTFADQIAVVLDKIKLIGEKEKLQQQLLRLQVSKERSRFKLVVHAVSEGIFVTDRNMNITVWNPAAEKMTGWPASEALGKQCSQLLDYRDQDGNRLCGSPKCPLESALNKGQYGELGRVSGDARDGRKLFLSINAAPLKDEKGQVTGGVMVLRDISSTVEMERMKSRLLSTISHELRTPLATIKGYSSMIVDYEQVLQYEETLEHVRSIDKAADRLAELVDRLLDMSRLEAGLFRLAKRDTAIRNLVVEAVADARLRSPEHKFRCELPTELPTIPADEKRIRQVLDNLLENSIRYSGPGTEIIIKARAIPREIEVSIADQGIGIQASEIDKVFEPMYHLENRLAHDPRGMGLGLPLCKELVKAHGGRIWLESQVDKGTTAYFTLPLSEHQGDASSDSRPPLFWWQRKESPSRHSRL